MLPDDKVSDRFRIGKLDISWLVDDFSFLINGKAVGFGDDLGPVKVVSEIGRGRNDSVREVEGFEEECQCKESEEEEALRFRSEEWLGMDFIGGTFLVVFPIPCYAAKGRNAYEEKRNG